MKYTLTLYIIFLLTWISDLHYRIRKYHPTTRAQYESIVRESIDCQRHP